jgi:hypothetical protein
MRRDALVERLPLVGLTQNRLRRTGIAGVLAAALLAVAAPAALAATTITSGPSGFANSTDASFSFTGSGSSFSCTLDGVAAGCTSPQAYHNLTEAQHSFHVQAVGGSGAPDPGDSRTWTVDVTPPDTSFTDSPANGQSGPSASWSFDSTEANSTFQCSLDGGVFATCTSPKTFSSLAQGLHVIQVRAKDQAGNNDGSPALGFWTADSTPPETTITKAPGEFDSSTSPTVEFSSSEGNSTFTCSVDGAPAAACASPKQLSGLADGAHTFSVQATDALGNVDPTAAAVQWTLDSTPPDTTLTQTPGALTTTTVANFKFTTAEPKASFECRLDAGQFAACSSPLFLDQLSEGSHTFAVRALDAKGNPDQTPAEFTWTVDLTGPERPVLSVESLNIAAPNTIVTPAPRRDRKAATHPPSQQQPTNPTVPFGVGAAVAHGVPTFSTGPALKVSWSNPGPPEPLTYYAVKEHFNMVDPWSEDSGQSDLVPPEATDTSAITNTKAGSTYCFNVLAHDLAGRSSYYGDAACTTMPRRSKSLIKSGAWAEKTGKSHYGGGYSQATQGSLSLKAYVPFSQGYGWVPSWGGIAVRHVGLVATRCRGCGTVKVTYRLYWNALNDGTTRTKTINLNASSDKPSQVIPLFSPSQPDFAQRLDVKIEITSRGKPVRIEGLGVTPL